MKSRKNRNLYSSVRVFKKRFSEAVEQDKKSMLTETDKEFIKKLKNMAEKDKTATDD